jgi:Homing endonuclease associated repeat
MAATLTARPSAADLRRRLGEGTTQRALADEYGVAQSTMSRWLNPDSAERHRQACRQWKRAHRRTCIDCGGRTGSWQAEVKRCRSCSADHQRSQTRWTREAILEAIAKWAAEHGRPPASTDWVRAGAYWPNLTTVQARFASWNAAIAAAGFKPNPPGRRRRPPA